jgi:hypothetical protein
VTGLSSLDDPFHSLTYDRCVLMLEDGWTDEEPQRLRTAAERTEWQPQDTLPPKSLLPH